MAMRRQFGGLAAVVVLALGLGLAGSGRPARADAEEDKLIKEAQKDVLDLAKEIEAGKDGAAKADAIKKKYEELNTSMQIYKPRERKGLGIGPKSKGDGIEIKIQNLGKRALSKAEAEKQKADLVKMCYINLAMAEVAKRYPPAKPVCGKGVKEWQEYVDATRDGSKELLEAVKAGDPAKIKKAAKKVDDACASCHADFRKT
jgi:cytochrome c556